MNTKRFRLSGTFWMILALARMGAGSDFVWIGAGDGTNWVTATNWDGGAGYPDGADDRAAFTNGAAAVTVPAGLTLGALELGTNYLGTNSLAGNLVLVVAGGQTGSLAVNGGMLRTGKDVVSGIAAAGSIRIGAGGTIVVRRSSMAGQGLGQTLVAAADMQVEGVLHADGEGFAALSGPGAGGGYLSPAGTHGGRGGYNNNPTYGSFTNPIALGSGGTHPGGGAISLLVTGELYVAGRISANGLGAITTSGGGAGGSINIAASRLTGNGLLQARGGPSGGRHGGGGGRITLVQVATNAFAGGIEVHGGDPTGSYMRGHAGTVAFPDNFDLTLGGAGRMQSLRLGRDDDHDYTFGAIVIAAGGTLELDGNRILNDDLGGPAVIHAASVTVQEGGRVSADLLGLPAGSGYQGSKGSTHGGRGGYDNTAATYGSFTNPVAFGSGAGGGAAYGGGAVKLVAVGRIAIDGAVSASGGTNDLYAGSGGSINLIASELSGTGIIRANGGTSTWRGGGGGGRISFVQVATNRFAGLIEVLPGESHRNYASAYAGTIAFPEGADLVLGGEGNMQTLRLGSDDDNNYVFGDIVIHEGGLLEIDGNPMRETFFGGAASVSATAINIHTGGLIRATAFGFGSSRAAPSNVVHSVGGAHGGAGGGAPLTYGSVVSPRNLGSGGGGTSTSGARNGGGAIILKAVETLNIDGAIACCGSDAVGAQGSGAGGTVNLEAGQLSGGGTIRADAGAATRNGGGGGRIALRAATSTFAGTCSALGGAGSASYNGPGAAGTVYTDLNGVKRLLVDNDKVIEAKPTYTWLPALTNAPAGELGDVALTVANLGHVALTNSIAVGDLHLRGAITSLFLNGHTLTVNTFYHRDWGDASLVDYAGGAVVWKRQGSILMLR